MEPVPQDIHTAVREDMDNAYEEAALGVAQARQGAVALAAGGACGLLALWSAHTTLLRGLERVWEPQRVAGALTLLYASGASVLVHYGSKRLRVARGASSEALHSSLDVVRHVVDELKEG
ncbi:phage holin family protein [Streptomyces sp. CB03238]|uniref:phage holin family protein n=1 Tax=Streptomyces sp. CB03238 TaxID=1907777 RepID=UPI000D1B12D1|nr:phage holin family protein [Streptomyces sp. CB03238]